MRRFTLEKLPRRPWEETISIIQPYATFVYIHRTITIMFKAVRWVAQWVEWAPQCTEAINPQCRGACCMLSLLSAHFPVSFPLLIKATSANKTSTLKEKKKQFVVGGVYSSVIYELHQIVIFLSFYHVFLGWRWRY